MGIDRWRIAANGAVAFFTVLGATVGAGAGDMLALKAACIGGFIQGGLVAAQEWKRQEESEQPPPREYKPPAAPLPSFTLF